MGWFDGLSDIGGASSTSRHHKSHKSKKHHSSSHSVFGGDNASRGSIFGSGGEKHNSSKASFFGFNTSPRSSSSSYYKRSPRQGYVQRLWHKLRRLLRDLKYYMKKHPMKVFMLVIMPLITGGALTTLLAKFGIRLPAGMERLFGGHNAGGGYGVGRGMDGGMHYERTKTEGSFPLGDVMGGVMGSMGGIGGAVSLAKMFM